MTCFSKFKPCGWQVGFHHSPADAQITQGSVKLCLKMMITSVLYGTLLRNHLAYFMHPESVYILSKINCDLFCAVASYFYVFYIKHWLFWCSWYQCLWWLNWSQWMINIKMHCECFISDFVYFIIMLQPWILKLYYGWKMLFLCASPYVLIQSPHY